jgi:hypothetical protein
MQKETNCSILIRGKGSVKPGQRKRNNTSAEDEDDEMHVLVTAENEDDLEKGVKMVRELLTPIGMLFVPSCCRLLAAVPSYRCLLLAVHAACCPKFERPH